MLLERKKIIFSSSDHIPDNDLHTSDPETSGLPCSICAHGMLFQRHSSSALSSLASYRGPLPYIFLLKVHPVNDRKNGSESLFIDILEYLQDDKRKKSTEEKVK